TVLSLFLLSSCSYSGKDFNFTAQERKLLAPFKAGDSLFYKGTNTNVDTLVVVRLDSTQKKEPGLIAAMAYTEIWVELKCLYGKKWAPGFFAVYRFPQQDRIDYVFDYKDFWVDAGPTLGSRHEDTLRVNGAPLTGYYIIEKRRPSHDSLENPIERIYWTEKAGLVAYQYRNGVTYLKQ
ncbi:MAG TPA: hypothetical protein VNW04_21925, partial [Puia sp.]|nr:hypothetical protein [Puia sp.]